jgi:protein phosphatase
MNPPGTNGVNVELFAVSDVGRTRDHNEDAFVVADPVNGNFGIPGDVVTVRAAAQGMLFMVADGMGGAAAGELASAMAVETVSAVLQELWQDAPAVTSQPDFFADSLRRATDAANARIHRFAQDNAEHRGMGTTATIAALRDGELFVSQVGDSRGYLARNGVVYQITRDQSLMQRLVDAGELTQEEAEQSERRNIILQALGPEPGIRSDISVQALRRGDTLLLCSDGLSGLVTASDMAGALSGDRNLRDACLELVALANERGGPDNITLVAARFSGDALPPPAPGERVGYTPYSDAGGDSWRFTPQDAFGEEISADTSWFEGTRASVVTPAELRAVESAAAAEANSKRSGGFSRAVVFGLLAAVLAGLAMVLYSRLF